MSRLLTILLSIIVSACSTSPSKNIAWDWQFSGKVYVQNGQDRDSANILWQHTDRLEIIQVSGPLGQGATRLSISPNSATLSQNGEIKAIADNADDLLAEFIDLPISIAQLRNWLVLSDSRANEFTNDGWTIQLSKFDSLSRPQKLTASNNTQKLILLISNWKP